MKKGKIITAVCMLVMVCIAITAVSYAWLRREWKPGFTGENIQIQSGSTLAIRLDNGATIDKLSLNDIADFPEDFRLKQVSNFTGQSEDFFGLDFTNGIALEDATIRHLSKLNDNQSNTDRGISYGYIEKSFFLVGSTGNESMRQYIYLDPESVIEKPLNYDPEDEEAYTSLINSIRVSITVHGKGPDGISDITHGIKLQGSSVPHTGIVNIKDYNGNYVAQGSHLDDEIITYIPANGASTTLTTPLVATDTGVFRSIEDYKITLVDGKLSESDMQRVLFVMEPSETVQVTMRIWLEGTADGCTNEISGLNFDMSIIFAGVAAPAAAEGGAE